MSIQQLPEDVIAQIKSSTAITSLNGVICGLLKNSLDSKATKITVSVDYARGNCSVEDNGSGIPAAEFSSEGGLGKLHYTSRFPPRAEIHGGSGTFLASLAALSLLSITSRHEAFRSLNSIKIHNSKVLARHTPSPPDQQLLTFSHGTRATVRDLFGSMPVRVKQRPVALDRAATSKEWDRLKISVAAILLPWPDQVAVSIRDIRGQQSTSMKNHEAIVVQSNERTKQQRNAARVASVIHQAQLSDDIAPESWITLNAGTDLLSIRGAVCLEPVATRKVQFISLGIRPISNERGSNVLYEEINRLFANSSFGVEEEFRTIDQTDKDRRARDGRYKTSSFTDRELQGRKGIDRWPMFHIRVDLAEQGNINSNGDLDRVFDEGQNNLTVIVELLKATIYEFLKKYHFRPLHYNPRQHGSSMRSSSADFHATSSARQSTPFLSTQPPSRSSSTSRSQRKLPIGDLATTRLQVFQGPRQQPPSFHSPFDGWTRVKSGRPTPSAFKPNPSEQGDIQSKPSFRIAPDPPLCNSSGDLIRAPFLNVDVPQGTLSSPQGEAVVENEQTTATGKTPIGDEIAWRNPIMTQQIVVDARTGFIKSNHHDPRPFKPGSSRLTLTKRPRIESPEVMEKTSDWTEDLSRWRNPVFESSESRIPVAFDGSKLLSSWTGPGPTKPDRCCHGLSEQSFSVEGRVSKDALRVAEVVAQVDRKFILAKVSSTNQTMATEDSGSTTELLVIIDQHAADERCRVEALMSNYFRRDISESSPVAEARSELLERPLQFEIPFHERSLFKRHATHFWYWGIHYQLSPSSITAQQQKTKLPSFLKVNSLPPGIFERCRTEPRLLIDLLRKEAWKLDDAGHERVTHQPMVPQRNNGADSSTGLHWLSRFHGCPQGILDMINSRACRSAIMFNDELTHDECIDLLRRLADCALPFQCAHGRPSMVPLIDMGDHKIYEEVRLDTGQRSFGKAFKQWKDTSEIVRSEQVDHGCLEI